MSAEKEGVMSSEGVAEALSRKDQIIEDLIEWIIGFAPKLFLAIITIVIGFWIVRILMRMMDRALIRSKVDISLHSFLNSVSEFLLKTIVVITAATMIGIPVTTFIAAISAASLAIGLALRDSLANFAGGILIIFFRMFSIGDYIELSGYAGEVKEIKLLFTKLTTFDNTVIIIPNGELATGKIKNYTEEKDRRLDMVFSIGYSDDIDKAKKIMNSVILSHPLARRDPEPLVQVSELGASSVDLVLKVWCHVDDYWTIYFDFKEDMKKAFDREAITIPFPQTDIHLYNQSLEDPESKSKSIL